MKKRKHKFVVEFTTYKLMDEKEALADLKCVINHGDNVNYYNYKVKRFSQVKRYLNKELTALRVKHEKLKRKI